MIVQVIFIRDENNKTLSSPKWEVFNETHELISNEVQAYLQQNPNHYAIFGQKWVDSN